MSRMADQVGRVLGGRYRVVAPIGAGASAQVFLAEDTVLRRRVAVKLLHAALAGDEAFLRRFQAEARAAAALSHPNVMAVYDWGEAEDGPFLVTELLSGGSLRALLDTGFLLSPSQALLAGLQGARGLEYAHRRGLVHRDIKPANLLFDDESRVRIADFGVARALADAAWTEPAGGLIGSARYASPEQAQGAALDGRSDVYSLALVMIEAVTGRVPFSGDDTITTLMARVDAPYVADPALGPLGPVIEHAAWPDASGRLDAAGLVQALEAVMPRLPRPEPLPVGEAVVPVDLTLSRADLHADPTMIPPLVRVAEVLAEPDTVVDHYDRSDSVSEAPTSRPRRRWPKVMSAVLLVMAIGVGAAFAVVRSRVPSHPVPDVTRLSVDAATAKLKALHFKVREQHTRLDGTTAGQVISSVPDKNVSLKEGREITLTVSDGPTLATVPYVSGLDRLTAIDQLSKLGFDVVENGERSTTVAKNRIISSSNAGQSLPKGTKIQILTSLGPPPVKIPNEKGQTFAKAQADLKALGLNAVEVDDYTDAVSTGQVYAMEPPAGTDQVEVGTTVTLHVSKGPKTITVPDVTGAKVTDAVSTLEAAGLTVSGVFGPHGYSGRVIYTDPAPGGSVTRGSGVNIYTT